MLQPPRWRPTRRSRSSGSINCARQNAHTPGATPARFSIRLLALNRETRCRHGLAPGEIHRAAVRARGPDGDRKILDVFGCPPEIHLHSADVLRRLVFRAPLADLFVDDEERAVVRMLNPQ